MFTDTDINKLTEVFPKNTLINNHLPLVKRFLQSPYFTKEMLEIPLASKAKELASEKRLLSKPELGIVCYFIFYSKAIFHAFVQSMPEWFGQMIEKLLWQKELHRNEVEKLVESELIKVHKDGNGYDYLLELRFFGIRDLGGFLNFWGRPWKQTYAAKPVAFYLPALYKNAIVDFYAKPKGYELVSIDALDETETGNIFNAEADILQKFPPLVSHFLTGNIKYSEKGRPNLAGLKKLQRTLVLKEFYNDGDTAFHPVRTMLILGMLHGLKQKDINDTSPNVIKKLFTNHFTKSKTPSSIANFIINQIKGIGYLSDFDYSNEAAPIFWNLMKEMPLYGWVTWNNIQIYLDTHFLEPQPIYGHSLHRLYFEENNDGDKIFINNNNRIEILQWPFVKGCIFLLAAYGIVEIAFTKPDTAKLGTTWFSEYDGLQALRLTNFGRFVFGKTTDYDPPIIANAAKLIFDEAHLIIRVEGDLNLTSSFWGKYVEKILPSRFAFRPILFLKDCKNAKQIQDKIGLFRKSINVKLPDYWESTFTEMIENATAITEQNDFYVFKLNGADKNLLNTIAHDGQLKSIIIKAERFYVLVEKKYKLTFKNRLMELGYFLE